MLRMVSGVRSFSWGGDIPAVDEVASGVAEGDGTAL